MAVKEKDITSEKSTSQTEQPAGFKSYVRIFHYANTTSRCLFAISFVSAIAAGVALPLSNIVFGQFVTAFNDFAIGQLSPAAYMRQVEKLALFFVYLFVAKFVLVYVSNLSASLAALQTTKELRVHFLQSLLRQDMAYFESKNTGSASIKVTTNGNTVTTGISDKLPTTITAITTFIAAFVVAFTVQWKLTLITIAIVPVIIVATVMCFVFDTPLEAKVQSYYSQAGNIAEEVFSTITTVHAFWLQPLMARRYDDLLIEARREGMKKSLIYGVLFSTQFFCVYSGYGLAFWQGIRMLVSGEITEPGKIVTVIFALVLASTSMQSIAFQVMNVTKASSAASELFAVIDRQPAIDIESDSGITPDTCNGHLEIHGVEFAYPTRPDSQILNGLSLDLPAKQTTALVGASGSGKSTIVGLLDRWYDQAGGTILLDGVDIRKLNLRWLRTQIGLVQQEPVLFSGSVYENVAHGLIGTKHENASEDEKLRLVQEACKEAFAHEFIERLPQQYFSQIGERARLLSGGQKQRIAIARSVISSPPILLLDEATSALDPRAETIVQAALDNVSESRTTLVIAHKLSTVQKADNIAVMSQGTVIEQGTHQELLARNRAYAKLVRAQSLNRTGSPAATEKSTMISDDDSQVGADDEKIRRLALSRTKSSHTQAPDSDSHEEQPSETMGYSLVKCLFLLVKEQPQWWPLYFALGLSSTLAGGTWPVLAILFSRVFGTFQLQGSEARSEGNFWALMYFIVAIANLIIYFSIGVVTNNIVQRVTRRYRLETFNNSIKQDLTFFDQETNATGAISSRLSTYATDLHELLGFNSGLILNNMVTVVACAVLGIAYGWKLGLACTFGALPPLILGGYARVRLETKLDKDTATRFASSAALAAEAIAAIRTVASLTLETTILREYQKRLSTVASKSAKSLVTNMLYYSATQSVNFLAMALGFWYGGKLVSSGEYTTQQFFVVFIAVVLGGESAASFFQYTSSMTKAGRAANYIFWLRQRVPAIVEDGGESSPSTEKDDDQPASVACNAVDFAYPTAPHIKVMNGIDVQIPAGKFVAFCGPSGCGKSTMISLLARFYDPSSGSILVNDRDIKDIGPRQHRRRLALVQQEPVLYSGSLRENVAMGAAESGEPTEAQVEAALRSANILDFVRSLPEGLDTSLGDRGTQLSGGQRQRCAIARALIRDPKLLLLDEATSALDTESEQIVQAALMDAAADGRRTTIAVAHRLSTIRNADTIFVFQSGRIVEAGTHASLLAQKNVYFTMCEGQALDSAV